MVILLTLLRLPQTSQHFSWLLKDLFLWVPQSSTLTSTITLVNNDINTDGKSNNLWSIFLVELVSLCYGEIYFFEEQAKRIPNYRNSADFLYL